MVHETRQQAVSFKEMMGKSRAIERIIAVLNQDFGPFEAARNKGLLVGSVTVDSQNYRIYEQLLVSTLERLLYLRDNPQENVAAGTKLIKAGQELEIIGDKPVISCTLKDDFPSQEALAIGIKDIGSRINGISSVNGAEFLIDDMKKCLHKGLDFWLDFADLQPDAWRSGMEESQVPEIG